MPVMGKERADLAAESALSLPGMLTCLGIQHRWGEWDKVILQVSIAVFLGAVEKFFRQRWLSPPRKN